jgi:hypothetical protein
LLEKGEKGAREKFNRKHAAKITSHKIVVLIKREKELSIKAL